MWLSFHMFCHDTKKHSELISKVSNILEKLLDQTKINKWFYIRYWLGSPHIRIRIDANSTFTLEDKRALVRDLIEINSENARFQLNKNSFYSLNKAGLNETDLKEKEYPWFLSGTVKEIDYIPEISRYGGDKLIGASENGFFYSSLLSLKFTELNSTKKILLTSAMMKLIAEQLIGQKSISLLFREASLNWKRTFSISDNADYSIKISDVVNTELLEKAKRIVENYSEIQSYLSILSSIKDQLNNEVYFKSILFSHFHMFNNRLGISPSTEMFIFKALQKEMEYAR